MIMYSIYSDRASILEHYVYTAKVHISPIDYAYTIVAQYSLYIISAED